MKILLINPFIAKEEIFKKGLKNVGALLPPLALAYIAAVLEQDKHVVKIIDCPVLFAKEGYNKRNLEKDIKNFNPAVDVLFSAYFVISQYLAIVSGRIHQEE